MPRRDFDVLLNRPYDPKDRDVLLQAYNADDIFIKTLNNCETKEKIYNTKAESCVVCPLVTKYLKTFKHFYFIGKLKDSYLWRSPRQSDYWPSHGDKPIWIANLESMEYTSNQDLICKKDVRNIKLFGYEDKTMNMVHSVMKNNSMPNFNKEKIVECTSGDTVTKFIMPTNSFTNVCNFVPTETHIVVRKGGRKYRINIFIETNGVKYFQMSFGTAKMSEAPQFKKNRARASSCMELKVSKHELQLAYLNLESSYFYANPDVIDEKDYNKRNAHCAIPENPGPIEKWDYRDWAELARQFALHFGQIYCFSLHDHMNVPFGTIDFKFPAKNADNYYTKMDNAKSNLQYLSVSRSKLFFQGSTSYQESLGVLPAFVTQKHVLHPFAYNSYSTMIRRQTIAAIDPKHKSILLRIYPNIDMHETAADFLRSVTMGQKANEFRDNLFNEIKNSEALQTEVLKFYNDVRYLCSTFLWLALRPSRHIEHQDPDVYEKIYDDVIENECFSKYSKDALDRQQKIAVIKKATSEALEVFDPLNWYYATNNLLKIYKYQELLPYIEEWKVGLAQ